LAQVFAFLLLPLWWQPVGMAPWHYLLCALAVPSAAQQASAGAYRSSSFAAITQRLTGRRCGRSPICPQGSTHCDPEKYRGVILRCDEKLASIRKAFKTLSPIQIAEATRLVETEGGEKGAGKSGADFIRTPDGEYFLKTMTKRDLRSFKTFARAYHEHMVKYHDTTLLVRVIAIVVMPDRRIWLVMNNWLPLHFRHIYDLKGSSSGRRSKDEKTVWKDQNWDEHPEHHPVLPIEDLAEFHMAINRDTNTLSHATMIDYSLVYGRETHVLSRCDRDSGECGAPVCADGLGCADAAKHFHTDGHPGHWGEVHDYFCQDRKVRPHYGHRCVATMHAASPGDPTIEVNVYCFGIIDILKYFRKYASAEYIVRGGVLGRDISAWPPLPYASRFRQQLTETFREPTRQEPQRFIFSPDDRACGVGSWSTEAGR